MKITLFLYSYNHENFIDSAIDAVLSQNTDDIEVILSDDASKDNTFSIMQQKVNEYKGNKRILLNRNKQNLGITNHLNKIMKMGTGEWFILCAGDDISFINRVSHIIELINKYPNVMAINTEYEIINQYGKIKERWHFNVNKPYVTGATGAWNRKIFDFFGPITMNTTAEDVVIPYRAMLLGNLLLDINPTIYYRVHETSVSSPQIKDVKRIREHSLKICDTLINACKQRLLDLEKAKIYINSELYISQSDKHNKIISMLNNRREGIKNEIIITRMSFIQKINYTITGNNKLRHNTFFKRLKKVLLTNNIIFYINGRFRHKSPNILPFNKNELINIEKLNNDFTNQLIYL